MSKKLKILMVAEAVTLAHVARILKVGEILGKALPDVQLIFAFDEKYRFFLEDEKTFFHLPCMDSKDFSRAVDRYHFPYTNETLNTYVMNELHLIEQIGPDLIIGDFRITLAISARKKITPYISLTNFYWMPDYPGPLKLPDIFPLRLLPEFIGQMLFSIFSPMVYRLEARPFNQIAEKYGISQAKGSLLKIYTQADHIFLVEPPGWDCAQAPMGSSFIGPISWTPDSMKLPPWWPEVNWEIPTIYISVGSSGSTKMIQAAVSALQDCQCQLVVAGLPDSNTSFGSVKFYSSPFLPNNLALKHARGFVFNGGSLSMVEALKLGKPLIGIASNYDQFLNLTFLERKGVARAHLSRNLNLKKLSTDLRSLFEPDATTKENLIKAQIIFSKPPNEKNLVDAIQMVLNSKNEFKS